jgi:2-oxoacid:acceptor oxidoreductase delta subunit (pyruvate/2-ketoisovalerate family)
MSWKVYPKDAGYKDMVAGGYIPQAGNAVEYSVAGWRITHPVRDDEKCINCLFCWIYCPDVAVNVESESVKGLGFDLEHCKGCGICAAACPVKCITMAEGAMPQEGETAKTEG